MGFNSGFKELMLCTEVIAVYCQNHTHHICIFYTVRANWRGKGKGKFHSRTRHEGPDGALGGWVVKATPRPFYPREIPDTHCTGGWVGTGVALDGFGKSRPPLGFDPWTVQPVASRYTD